MAKKRAVGFKKIFISFGFCISCAISGVSVCAAEGEEIREVVVDVDATDLGVLEKIEAIYVGSASTEGDALSTEDFVVYPYYSFKGSDKAIRFGQLEDGYTISKTKLDAGENEIVVSFRGVQTIIAITTRGNIYIVANGMNFNTTVAALKQEEDEEILESGKNIIYTIKASHKTTYSSGLTLPMPKGRGSVKEKQ